MTAAALFDELLALVGVMNVEEQRAVREGLDSEEDLAIFDILTKPEPKLGPEDEDLVKRVAKSLLEKLKAEKLVLDWRLKERAKAGVKATIASLYDERLPPAYREAFSTRRSSGPINGFSKNIPEGKTVALRLSPVDKAALPKSMRAK
jgi:hypothetical protein